MEIVSSSTLTTPFPVGHKKTSLEIKGNKTDVIVCRYDDYFMVMVTQLGCVGTILHARKEEGFASDPTFSVSVIFGKRDEPLLVACGRQLIEHIRKPGNILSVIHVRSKEHPSWARARTRDLYTKEHAARTRARWCLCSCGSSRPLVLTLGLKDHSPGTLKEIISTVIENRLW